MHETHGHVKATEGSAAFGTSQTPLAFAAIILLTFISVVLLSIGQCLHEGH